MKNKMLLKMTTAAAVLLTGCEKSADSFSLLSDSSTFKQSTNYVQRKVDILWVIDNSGSMETSQQNLASNFQSFIHRFSRLNYDFQMGVVTTDAYLHAHYNNPARSQLRDGSGGVPTGFRIMDSLTPDLNQVFIRNISQGINGNGDERAFSSMELALKNNLNNGFVREGSFLSVIIVSDEDDFSHNDATNGIHSYFFTENYNHASMYPISRFTGVLDEVTRTQVGGVRNYSVSVISILDNDCYAELSDEWPGRKIGRRYRQIAEATEGTLGSLCSDFGQTLSMISDKVLELSSSFVLDREPYIESIVVTVNGSSVVKDEDNGWSYDEATRAISFHGTAIPPAGADVRIFFDPKSVKL